MKAVFEKTNQHRKFAELKPGEMFCWHGSLYIKIKNNTGDEVEDFFTQNTVGVFSGEFWSVCDTAVTELVTCELSDESEERMLIC